MGAQYEMPFLSHEMPLEKIQQRQRHTFADPRATRGATESIAGLVSVSSCTHSLVLSSTADAITAAMTVTMAARSDAQEIEQLLRADLQNSSYVIDTVRISFNRVQRSTLNHNGPTVLCLATNAS
jgi:hypothetical protein